MSSWGYFGGKLYEDTLHLQYFKVVKMLPPCKISSRRVHWQNMNVLTAFNKA